MRSLGDTGLSKLLAPSRQIYEGPMFDYSPERWRAIMGQVNPEVQNNLAMQHGRFLSGLGEANMPAHDQEAIDRTAELNALEEQDDVYGSGIFDDPRRGGTANIDTGVFESHYNLPGYLGRQQPFTYSDEVASLPSGAAYAEVPSGGMHYVEAHGRAVDFPKMGPTPKPPQLTTNSEQGPGDFPLSEPGSRMQPYAYLSEEETDEYMTPLNAPQPDTGPSAPALGQANQHSPYYRVAGGHSPRMPAYRTVQLPTRPGTRRLPRRPATRRLARRAPFGQADNGNGNGEMHWTVYLGIGLGVGALAAVGVEMFRR